MPDPLLYALCLGDGHLRKRDGAPSLSIRHCHAQKDYLTHKAQILSNILGKAVNTKEFNNSGFPGVRLEVRSAKFEEVYDSLYVSGKKTLSLSFLNHLDLHGIAIWYMDDGSLTAKKRNGKVHAFDLVISTCCSKEEALACIHLLHDRFGVVFSLKKVRDKYSIRCGTKAAVDFLAAIEEYSIPCMEYKFRFTKHYPSPP